MRPHRSFLGPKLFFMLHLYNRPIQSQSDPTLCDHNNCVYILRYCIVGFGVRAVYRKTPIYFICMYHYYVINIVQINNDYRDDDVDGGGGGWWMKTSGVPLLIIIITRPWPAFGRQGLVGSSFEYSYTRLASRLRRSARSGIMTLGKDKTPKVTRLICILAPQSC